MKISRQQSHLQGTIIGAWVEGRLGLRLCREVEAIGFVVEVANEVQIAMLASRHDNSL